MFVAVGKHEGSGVRHNRDDQVIITTCPLLGGGLIEPVRRVIGGVALTRASSRTLMLTSSSCHFSTYPSTCGRITRPRAGQQR